MKKTMGLIAIIAMMACGGNTKTDKKANMETVYGTPLNKEKLQRDSAESFIKISAQTNAMLDSLHPNITSANRALLAYGAMTKADREAIKTIDVELLRSKELQASYTYDVAFMAGVQEKAKVFERLSKALVDRQFAVVDDNRDQNAVPNGIGPLLEKKFAFLEKKYGKLKSYEIFGIAEQGGEAGTAYQFQAYLDFHWRKVPYFFYLDTQKGKDQWVGFSIDN